MKKEVKKVIEAMKSIRFTDITDAKEYSVLLDILIKLKYNC